MGVDKVVYGEGQRGDLAMVICEEIVVPINSHFIEIIAIFQLRAASLLGKLLSINFLLASMFSTHIPFYRQLSEKIGLPPTECEYLVVVYHIGIFVKSTLLGRFLGEPKAEEVISLAFIGEILYHTYYLMYVLLD